MEANISCLDPPRATTHKHGSSHSAHKFNLLKVASTTMQPPTQSFPLLKTIRVGYFQKDEEEEEETSKLLW